MLGRSTRLHRVFPLFRSPALLHLNRALFLPLSHREAVLHMLAYGLRGEWGPVLPPPNRIAPNYLGSPEARHKCRPQFQSEVRAGRMIGGPGWTQSRGSSLTPDMAGITYATTNSNNILDLWATVS